MFSQRNVELPHWYVQLLSMGILTSFDYSKPHTYSTFIGKVKENEMHVLSLPRQLRI